VIAYAYPDCGQSVELLIAPGGVWCTRCNGRPEMEETEPIEEDE
jgi:DNA-directed RNA polymerase subunit RPC12/RpoP